MSPTGSQKIKKVVINLLTLYTEQKRKQMNQDTLNISSYFIFIIIIHIFLIYRSTNPIQSLTTRGILLIAPSTINTDCITSHHIISRHQMNKKQRTIYQSFQTLMQSLSNPLHLHFRNLTLPSRHSVTDHLAMMAMMLTACCRGTAQRDSALILQMILLMFDAFLTFKVYK